MLLVVIRMCYEVPKVLTVNPFFNYRLLGSQFSFSLDQAGTLTPPRLWVI